MNDIKELRDEAWRELNRIMDLEGDSPSYRAAWKRWANLNTEYRNSLR